MWLPFDWREGSKIAGRRTPLFCVFVEAAVRLAFPAAPLMIGSVVDEGPRIAVSG
ncbi:hypothetical protein [Nocardia sp. alder85J]|uniref:hypothetical protein n=1 Tax=Nocardia sp. alder85J TaxID=2862949 RepID=UPI001CD35BC9|nr:hypothetical protein [Nocardia sp. alder85J]MCX4098392.1 hypothetical protein [Nocardia sp. alder85J]